MFIGALIGFFVGQLLVWLSIARVYAQADRYKAAGLKPTVNISYAMCAFRVSIFMTAGAIIGYFVN